MCDLGILILSGCSASGTSIEEVDPYVSYDPIGDGPVHRFDPLGVFLRGRLVGFSDDERPVMHIFVDEHKIDGAGRCRCEKIEQVLAAFDLEQVTRSRGLVNARAPERA